MLFFLYVRNLRLCTLMCFCLFKKFRLLAFSCFFRQKSLNLILYYNCLSWVLQKHQKFRFSLAFLSFSRCKNPEIFYSARPDPREDIPRGGREGAAAAGAGEVQPRGVEPGRPARVDRRRAEHVGQHGLLGHALVRVPGRGPTPGRTRAPLVVRRQVLRDRQSRALAPGGQLV